MHIKAQHSHVPAARCGAEGKDSFQCSEKSDILVFGPFESVLSSLMLTSHQKGRHTVYAQHHSKLFTVCPGYFAEAQI